MTQDQQTTVLHAPIDIAAGAVTHLPNGTSYEAWDTPAGVVVNVNVADVEAMTAHGYSAGAGSPLSPAVNPSLSTQSGGESTSPPALVSPQNTPSDPVAMTVAVLADPPSGGNGS